MPKYEIAIEYKKRQCLCVRCCIKRSGRRCIPAGDRRGDRALRAGDAHGAPGGTSTTTIAAPP